MLQVWENTLCSAHLTHFRGKMLLLALVFGVQSSAVILASGYGLHSPRVQKHGERQGGRDGLVPRIPKKKGSYIFLYNIGNMSIITMILHDITCKNHH